MIINFYFKFTRTFPSDKKKMASFAVQVSLAIRGGCVPGKSSTANTKTAILSFK